jgi:hypothetical protein
MLGHTSCNRNLEKISCEVLPPFTPDAVHSDLWVSRRFESRDLNKMIKSSSLYIFYCGKIMKLLFSWVYATSAVMGKPREIGQY